MLSRHAGQCRMPHGHSRSIEIILEADKLDENGMVIDFKTLKEIAVPVVNAYDHALCVNSADPNFATLIRLFGEAVVPFENCEPTTENLARRLYEELRHRLQHPPHSIRQLKLCRVRVSETAATWAEYEPKMASTSEPRTGN